MTLHAMISAVRGWKPLVIYLALIMVSVGSTELFDLWKKAGAPLKILVQDSTMHVVRNGDTVTVATLRKNDGTNCTITVARVALRDDWYDVPQKMRDADRALPARVYSQVSYSIFDGPIPNSNPGLGIGRFSFRIPDWWPPGHYHYKATFHALCPMIPNHNSVMVSPPDDVSWDIVAPSAARAP